MRSMPAVFINHLLYVSFSGKHLLSEYLWKPKFIEMLAPQTGPQAQNTVIMHAYVHTHTHIVTQKYSSKQSFINYAVLLRKC
jgi:hypothetical protein